MIPDNVIPDSVETWINTIGFSAANFILKAVIAVVIYVLVRKIVYWLSEWLDDKLEKAGMETSIRAFFISLAKYGILIFTVFSIVVQLNIVTASSIAALLASGGVGVTLALQGGLSNLAGGVILLALHPFKAGDYVIIKSADVEGTVSKIEMYYTTVLTVDNMTVVLPNSSLMNNAVINVTAQEKRKLEIKTGISYEADIHMAKKVLEQLIKEDPRLEEEGSQVFVDSLADSAVVIGFRAWVKTEDYLQTKWDMNEKIKHAFDEAKINIPYNQMDVHLTQE